MDEKIEVNEVKKSSKLKRNITILVVVLCISAAVYLNWEYSLQGKGESALTDVSLISEKNNEEIPVSAEDYVSEYFAQARLVRQEARDKSYAMLEAMTTSEAATPENISTVMDKITTMTMNAMLETQIENVILAKGFADCVVSMGEDKIIVAVPSSAEGLTAEEVARITDAIITETNYNTTQITVIPVRKPTTEPVTPEPAQLPGESGEEAETETGLLNDLASQGGYIEDGAVIYE